MLQLCFAGLVDALGTTYSQKGKREIPNFLATIFVKTELTIKSSVPHHMLYDKYTFHEYSP